MQMDKGMDTGPILSMRATEIGEEETAPELSARLSQIGAELLSETLPLVDRGEIRPVAQNDDEATYAPLLKREDGLIDWRMSAPEMARRVRAFQPWPGTFTFFRGSRLMLWKARYVEQRHHSEPATITGLEKSGVLVACASETALLIEEIQLEGKRRMSARDFINGLRLAVGDRMADL
jgi:methionyl-tRNA formyltransferase